MRYHNCFATISNYAVTSELASMLNKYGQLGYRLVSTEMAKNQHGVEVMYLFFTKEIEEK